jgi:hypothetical protein
VPGAGARGRPTAPGRGRLREEEGGGEKKKGRKRKEEKEDELPASPDVASLVF